MREEAEEEGELMMEGRPLTSSPEVLEDDDDDDDLVNIFVRRYTRDIVSI